jgi:hypothetical protein
VTDPPRGCLALGPKTRVIETTDESNLLDLFVPTNRRSGSILEIDEDGTYDDDDLYRNLGLKPG